MTKKFAFTLAEVLIALAIIGVVAAMTIPTFMANTTGAQFKTGLKKTIAVLTQAAATNYATEGYNFDDTPGLLDSADGAFGDSAVSDGNPVVGFNTVTTNNNGTDLGRENSLFHIFQNNLNMKNSQEIENYDVAGTPATLSCASRVTNVGDYTNPTMNGEIRKAGGDLKISNGGGLRALCDPSSLSNNEKIGAGINQGRMFQLEDGAVFTWDPAQGTCTAARPCYGYIDVNGPTGPNRQIACSAGSDAWITNYGKKASATMLTTTCTVDQKDISDIYPVAFYDSIVKPASVAAKAVLENTKSNQSQSTSGATSPSDDGGDDNTTAPSGD